MTALLAFCTLLASSTTPVAMLGPQHATPDTVGPRVPERFANTTTLRVSDARVPDRGSHRATPHDTSRSATPHGTSRSAMPHDTSRSAKPHGTVQHARDRWFAIDKAQHFVMAYGTAMIGYGVLRGADVSHTDAQTGALAGSLVIGVGKELFDRARGGAFSFKDLTMDALGTLAAWGMISLNR